MLEQKQSDQELSVHVLDSLTAGIAVLDKDGSVCIRTPRSMLN